MSDDRRVTIVLGTTLFGVAVAVTALDPVPRGRRILVVATNATLAEVVPAVHHIDGFQGLADRFDAVHSLNELIEPFHPSRWVPGGDDVVVVESLLRRLWGLGDAPVRLVLESIQVRPAQTLAAIFPDAPITVYADGLMSYGPTRNPLAPAIHSRIRELVHPDLVAGVQPLLLQEYGVASRCFDVTDLAPAMAAIGAAATLAIDPPVPAGATVAVVVGQYLADLRLIGAEAATALDARMIAAAAAHGATHVVYKPHPNSPDSAWAAVAAAAAAAGIGASLMTSAAPLEAFLDRLAPAFVLGAFSTALTTVPRLGPTRPLQVGASELLDVLRPYENSNRIPLLLVEQTVPDGEGAGPAPDPPDLQRLVEAIGYVMQPTRRADLRAAADAVIAAPDGMRRLRLTRGQLTRRRLPGGLGGGTLGGAVVRRVLRTPAYRRWRGPALGAARRARSLVRRTTARAGSTS